GGHRIPLLIRWPNYIDANLVSDEPVCLTDLMATLADIVEMPLPDNTGEDSVSNLPLWKNEKLHQPLREATVHHSIDGSFSIRQGDWKLELCPGSGGWSDPKPGEETASILPECFVFKSVNSLNISFIFLFVSSTCSVEGLPLVSFKNPFVSSSIILMVFETISNA